MTWLNKASQNKKRRPLFSKNVLKIVPIHVYKFSFLNTSNTYRVFGNYFRPRWKPLVDARVGDSRRLLSEVFERKADYFMLTTSSEKNFSLIASRKEKSTWNIVKITFSCGNYNIFTFFSCCLPETRAKDHRKRSPFFEFQAKYLCLELETSGLLRGTQKLSSGSISARYVKIRVRYSS